MELSKHQTNLQVTEESIKIGNEKLQEAFSEKPLSRKKNPKWVIDMVLEWKHKLNNVI